MSEYHDLKHPSSLRLNQRALQHRITGAYMTTRRDIPRRPVFRVRLDDLKPRTTYYYTVDSMEANGRSDGVASPINNFTTP